MDTHRGQPRVEHDVGSRPDAVVNGNVVRGFFIHNAAVIKGPVWRGGKEART